MRAFASNAHSTASITKPRRRWNAEAAKAAENIVLGVLGDLGVRFL
jgi:hypothetical protein